MTTDMGRIFFFIKAVKDTDVFINKSGLKTRDFMEAARFWQGWEQEIKAQKERLFLWIPVAFAAGIAIYFALPFEPSLLAAGLFLTLLAGAGFKLYSRQFRNRLWFFNYIACMAMVLAVSGFCAASLESAWRGTPVLEKPLKFANVEATIESIEKLEGKRGSRVVLKDVAIEELPRDKTPRKIRLTFRKDEGLKAGMRIKTLGNLDAPSHAVLPGAYDFRRHLFFEGIGAVGFSYKAATLLKEDNAFVFFETMRAYIHSVIGQNAGKVSAGIMGALITGERGEIAKEDNDAMRNSGLYHLLSISGSHVAMVTGVLFFFLRLGMAAIPWLAIRYPIKKIAAMVAMLGAAFYVVLAGADVPAIRALIMTALVMMAILLDRSPLSLRLIAFAAMMVLVFVPHSLVGVSFQMSFSAVAALICFFEYIRVWWIKIYSSGGFARKAVMYLAAIGLTSIIAGGMTGFFSLYHFQSFAVYGVLSNMLAVPLTAFVIMPAAVLAMIMMPFGMAAWPLKIMEWGVLKMLTIAYWAAGFKGAVIHVHQWPLSTLVLLSMGMVLFLLWGGWRGKGVALSFVVLGLVVAGFAKLPDVMVSGTGKLVGVRAGGDFYISSFRKEKFTSENWMRLLGHADEKPSGFYGVDSPVRCDDYACRWEGKGVRVSVVKKEQAVREECAWARLVVAAVPVPVSACPKGVMVYDLFDFKRDGAHAFYVGGDAVRGESVGDYVGRRPWR